MNYNAYRRFAPDGIVEFDGTTATFRGILRPHVRRHFMLFISRLARLKPTEISLDFSGCKRAYPNTIVPIVSRVHALASTGLATHCILPADEEQRRMFLRFNWAHYLEPAKYHPTDTEWDRHLSLQNYRSEQEHHILTNAFVDVAMRTLELNRSILAGLEWSVSEIMDNVLMHANCPTGGFVQLVVYKEKERIAFCVADAGRGILNSLREARPNLQSDEGAIGEAVRAGVTRNKDIGQGNGLSGTLAIAMASDGHFAITSGRAEVTWESTVPNHKLNDHRKRYEGTIVDVQFPFAANLDLAAVLSEGSKTPRFPHVDLIETKYLSSDQKSVVVKMKDETTGFGSRKAGLQMRTKCKNLMNAEQDCRLVIDWDGIQMVASSYSDEFIGKLFVELGPIGFMARVQQINMIPVVQELVNRAIIQRTRQTLESADRDA
jgi:anti-sigma regulatory factor (Ser/Thr protein kinase)